MESSTQSVDKSDFYSMLNYSINANPGSLVSELLQAIQDGDVGDLREMVSGMDEEDRAELAVMDICGSGLLHVAVYLGELEVCKYFVEELGFDVNAGSLCGVTPLSSAALFGEEVIARYLLDHGADPNKLETSGSVALHNAAKNGNKEVVRLLLSRGARVDIAVAHGTPLHIAASYGKTSVVKILLDHHADPNRISEVSGTPLVTAIHSTKHGLSESDSLECVKLLVKAGADVNSANPNTPLVVATMRGLTECIKYLLEAGANPNISDKQQGRMPIQIAASFGRRSHVEILFPFTSPISAVSNWTVEGIIAHKKLKCSIPKDESCNKIKDRIAELKSQGKKAVKRNDFLGSSNLYTKALELDYSDETLHSNRSFCYLKIGKPREALFDADFCIAKRPEWVKGYYRKGAAHMSLKEYEEASEAFLDGLELDAGNAELEKMLREACEAMGKDHTAGGSVKSTD